MPSLPLEFPLQSPNFSTDLTGQTAVVTGASSGLGKRFAQVLAGCGASVILVSRREALLAEVAREITAAGGRATPLAADLRNSAEVETLIGRAQAELGLVSILVNNAGQPDGYRATRMPIEVIDEVLTTNLRAPYILSCEVARRLIEAKRSGRIVNISSMSAFDYRGQGAALYSTTKAALNRMTETLAIEWAKHHINVNAIAPGAFATEMLDRMVAKTGDLAQDYPRGRLGLPEQLDSTLLYLVSPSSDCVTGAILKVDDGQRAR